MKFKNKEWFIENLLELYKEIYRRISYDPMILQQILFGRISKSDIYDIYKYQEFKTELGEERFNKFKENIFECLEKYYDLRRNTFTRISENAFYDGLYPNNISLVLIYKIAYYVVTNVTRDTESYQNLISGIMNDMKHIEQILAREDELFQPTSDGLEALDILAFLITLDLIKSYHERVVGGNLLKEFFEI